MSIEDRALGAVEYFADDQWTMNEIHNGMRMVAFEALYLKQYGIGNNIRISRNPDFDDYIPGQTTYDISSDNRRLEVAKRLLELAKEYPLALPKDYGDW